jgi:hypothetical protein
MGIQLEWFPSGGALRCFDFGLIEMIGHGGVELGDAFAAGLVAKDIILLGVVVSRVVLAHVLVQTTQCRTLFHYILPYNL